MPVNSEIDQFSMITRILRGASINVAVTTSISPPAKASDSPGRLQKTKYLKANDDISLTMIQRILRGSSTGGIPTNRGTAEEKQRSDNVAATTGFEKYSGMSAPLEHIDLRIHGCGVDVPARMSAALHRELEEKAQKRPLLIYDLFDAYLKPLEMDTDSHPDESVSANNMSGKETVDSVSERNAVARVELWASLASRANGDDCAALRGLSASVRIWPTFSAYVNRAALLSERGMLGACLADCNAALAMCPGSALALTRRALTNVRLGRKVCAVRDAAAAAQADPDNVVARLVRTAVAVGHRRRTAVAARSHGVKKIPKPTLQARQYRKDVTDCLLRTSAGKIDAQSADVCSGAGAAQGENNPAAVTDVDVDRLQVDNSVKTDRSTKVDHVTIDEASTAASTPGAVPAKTAESMPCDKATDALSCLFKKIEIQPAVNRKS